jgi:hypothetical protein
MKLENAVELAVNNVYTQGVDDILPRPFELDYLADKVFKRKVCNHVVSAIKGNSIESLSVVPLKKILLPKKSIVSFRRCAIIDPIDCIKYLSLAILVAEIIEKKRPPVHRKIVFSYRYKPSHGYIFSRAMTFFHFRKEANRLSALRKHLVKVNCDIANFYDRINLHRLENVLHSVGCDNWLVGLLNNLLLFWSERDSYGLPVGSNASRILAEAVLIGIDNYLITNKVRFVRFVDDYVLFAKNAELANYWIELLITRLSVDGLSLNTEKTKIADIG